MKFLIQIFLVEKELMMELELLIIQVKVLDGKLRLFITKDNYNNFPYLTKIINNYKVTNLLIKYLKL